MITKECIETYREYRIYEITFGNGEIYYNAHSDYLTEGFISAVGDNLDKIYKDIDNIYARVKLLRSLPWNRQR